MKYFQLFCDRPSLELMEEFLRCFNINGIDESKEFCKNDLVEANTVEKIYDMLPELIMYYLPCKAKIYLNDINEKRAITILCQFLKLFEYRLCRKERIINRKKTIYYRIQKLEDSRLHISNFNHYELLFK
jgi:hypothetical protein